MEDIRSVVNKSHDTAPQATDRNLNPSFSSDDQNLAEGDVKNGSNDDDEEEEEEDFKYNSEPTDDQILQTRTELQNLRLDLGYTDSEHSKEYELSERVRRLNEELANETPLPVKEGRQQSVRFKENLVDFISSTPEIVSSPDLSDTTDRSDRTSTTDQDSLQTVSARIETDLDQNNGRVVKPESSDKADSSDTTLDLKTDNGSTVFTQYTADGSDPEFATKYVIDPEDSVSGSFDTVSGVKFEKAQGDAENLTERSSTSNRSAATDKGLNDNLFNTAKDSRNPVTVVSSDVNSDASDPVASANGITVADTSDPIVSVNATEVADASDPVVSVNRIAVGDLSDPVVSANSIAVAADHRQVNDQGFYSRQSIIENIEKRQMENYSDSEEGKVLDGKGGESNLPSVIEKMDLSENSDEWSDVIEDEAEPQANFSKRREVLEKLTDHAETKQTDTETKQIDKMSEENNTFDEDVSNNSSEIPDETALNEARSNKRRDMLASLTARTETKPGDKMSDEDGTLNENVLHDASEIPDEKPQMTKQVETGSVTVENRRDITGDNGAGNDNSTGLPVESKRTGAKNSKQSESETVVVERNGQFLVMTQEQLILEKKQEEQERLSVSSKNTKSSRSSQRSDAKRSHLDAKSDTPSAEPINAEPRPPAKPRSVPVRPVTRKTSPTTQTHTKSKTAAGGDRKPWRPPCSPTRDPVGDGKRGDKQVRGRDVGSRDESPTYEKLIVQPSRKENHAKDERKEEEDREAFEAWKKKKDADMKAEKKNNKEANSKEKQRMNEGDIKFKEWKQLRVQEQQERWEQQQRNAFKQMKVREERDRSPSPNTKPSPTRGQSPTAATAKGKASTKTGRSPSAPSRSSRSPDRSRSVPPADRGRDRETRGRTSKDTGSSRDAATQSASGRYAKHRSKKSANREEEVKKEECDWLKKKQRGAAAERREKKKEKSKKSTTTDSEEDEENREERGAWMSMEEWKRMKVRQRREERMRQLAEDKYLREGAEIHQPSDCEKAYRSWLRAKRREARQQREAEQQKESIARLLLRRSRKSLALATAVTQARSLYTDYYGYRF